MPRRPRPPITAREIGAYLSGTRAAKGTGYALLTVPELDELAFHYAEEDAPIAAAMEAENYLYWFVRGYEAAVRLSMS